MPPILSAADMTELIADAQRDFAFQPIIGSFRGQGNVSFPRVEMPTPVEINANPVNPLLNFANGHVPEKKQPEPKPRRCIMLEDDVIDD